MLQHLDVFGPTPPEGPPPAGVVRLLTETGQRRGVAMGAAIALPLSRYGPRALPALQVALPALEVRDWAKNDLDLMHLLPVFALAGHPRAAELVRTALGPEASPQTRAPVIAARILRDPGCLPLLEARLKNGSWNENRSYSLDRAIRAIRGEKP
jgi:hypothetical protein